MNAAVAPRGVLSGGRPPRLDGGVGELAAVEAILVQVDHDRVAVLDQRDRSAESVVDDDIRSLEARDSRTGQAIGKGPG